MLALYVYLCSSTFRQYTVPSIHGAFMDVCFVVLTLTCICCVGLPIYWMGGYLWTQCDYGLCTYLHWLCQDTVGDEGSAVGYVCVWLQ